MKNLSLKKIVTIGGLFLLSPNVFATDWLMLQGAEEKGTSSRANVWGFIQASFDKDFSKPYKNPLDQGSVCTVGTTAPTGQTVCPSPGATNSPNGVMANYGNKAVYVPSGGTVYTPPSPTYIAPMMVGPDGKTQEAFNVNRARFGVRGTPFPIDDKVNYFILAEFANNAITNSANGSVKVTDASVTLNHIPGARVRVGLFKTPGAEEGLQAIHVFNYVEFTQVTNQLLLERLPNAHYTPNNSYANSTVNGIYPTAGPTTQSGTVANTFTNTAAFRDSGVQIFDAFAVGKNLELSYAGMIGNGNGLNTTDNDKAKDKYGYVAAEWILGGKGATREGIKLFGWTQNGKRKLDTTDDLIDNPKQHTRIRKGGGITVKTKSFRFTAEYMWGRGMIFVGPDKPTFDQNGETRVATVGQNKGQPIYSGGDGADGLANGWYGEIGYFVKQVKGLEFDFRYDIFNRLVGDKGPDVSCSLGNGLVFQNGLCSTPRSFYSVWKGATLGVQYYFNPKNRITLNMTARSVHSPEWRQSLVITDVIPVKGANETDSAFQTRAYNTLKNLPNFYGDNPEKTLSRLDKRVSLQVTSIF